MRADRLLALMLAAFTGTVSAAEIVLVVADASGVGFRDESPALAAAGNNGATTLGEQRLRVVERAAEIWADRLISSVPIRIEIRMQAQACDSDGTTLASAGPVDLAANFSGAPRGGTNYHIAQANAHASIDLSSGNNDIRATFNLSLDSACSANAVGWWYGLDPDVPVPPDRIALLPVALHELAHGLGFSAPYNLETGAQFGTHPPVWANYLHDLQMARHWRELSAAERVASARNDPHLVWTGERVSRMASGLRGDPVLTATLARGGIGPYGELGLAEFGADPTSLSLEAQVVAVNDGVGRGADGCQAPFANGARLVGRFALIDRGECTFVEKAINAQVHGAIGVIVVNNVDGASVNMAGVDPAVTIPVVMITREQGRTLRTALRRPMVRMRLAPAATSSALAQGCLRMYAPADLQAGSSVSHFHSLASPNLLMEPSINRQLFDALDFTYDLFVDIGWPMVPYGSAPSLPDNCGVAPLP